MATFFDTHCHLADPAFEGEIAEVVARARAAGVTKIAVIGLDLDNSRASARLAREFDLLFTAGIHPAECQAAQEMDIQGVAHLLSDPLCVAVGEIGLDYYRKEPPHDLQTALFRRMLALASASGLPVVMHQRNSAVDVLRIVDEFDLPGKGVFHCFSGDEVYAEEVVRRGFYISMAGNVTYKNGVLGQVVAAAPLDRLLIETDAPYLTPHPHRGRRNEPAHLPHTAAKVAELRGIPVEELSTALSANAERLFRLRG